MPAPLTRPDVALLLLRLLRAVQDDGMEAHRARCRRLWPTGKRWARD